MLVTWWQAFLIHWVSVEICLLLFYHKINTCVPSNLRYFMILWFYSFPPFQCKWYRISMGLRIKTNKQKYMFIDCLVVVTKIFTDSLWSAEVAARCILCGFGLSWAAKGEVSSDLIRGRCKSQCEIRCTYEYFSLSIVDLKLTNQFLLVIWLISGNCFHIQVRILSG